MNVYLEKVGAALWYVVIDDESTDELIEIPVSKSGAVALLRGYGMDKPEIDSQLTTAEQLYTWWPGWRSRWPVPGH